jgi:ribonuclease R
MRKRSKNETSNKKSSSRRGASRRSPDGRTSAAPSSGRATNFRGVNPAQLLKIFRDENKPLSSAELLFRLGLTKKSRADLDEALFSLLDAGKIIRLKGTYGLTDRMRMLTGRLDVRRSGVGFVIPEDPRRKDIFIDPKNFGDAWHGDRVAVALTREGGDKKSAEGRIVRVIERGSQVLPATVMKGLGRGDFLVRPTDPRLDFALVATAQPAPRPRKRRAAEGQDGLPEALAPAPQAEARPPRRGDIVLVAPGERLERGLWEAHILETLGDEADVAVQERLVKVAHHVPTAFPDAALAEALMFPVEPDSADFAGREDLRALPLVTIDGATARDFDDAIHVEKTRGGYRLTVAIADVAHYVRPGSALDEEALARGNSYYFPSSVEPMLPQALSNGLCSLNPEVPRLCMAVVLDFDAKGRPQSKKVMNAVMKSHARLTYGQVNRAVLLKEPEEREGVAAVLPMLELAEKLARQINARRTERGSLDFDLPEASIVLSQEGGTLDIKAKPRHFGHQLIEEFMIAANEAVATFLEEQGLPCVYRIHPEPDGDRLRALAKLLAGTPLAPKLPREFTPQALQGLLHDAQGTDQEFLVSRLALRSMKQAKYSPDNQGHFGLASECYCHFTSPIRRYADLVVHRLVKVALASAGAGGGGGREAVPGLKKLGAACEHISARERVAMEAEREILKRLTILFLRDKIGQRFTGVISSMAEYGFWVELIEVMAEGMVRLSTLSDDYYAFWPDRQIIVGERTGRAFRLGEKITVRLEEASLSRLEVTLSLVEGGVDYKEIV